MLNAHIEALAQHLLPGGRRHGNYWTCGSVAGEAGQSLYIHLNGPKRGRWADSATGEFGDALDLIAACHHRGDRAAALKDAAAWLGLSSGHDAPVRRPPPPPPENRDDSGKFRAAALRLWLEAKPSVLDTPVDAYLRGRGIDLRVLGRQPRALRFHPALWNADAQQRLPAMVAAISGPDGSHVATHRTWLECRGGQWVKADLPRNKMVLGDFPGGSIRLWRGASGKSLKDAPPADPLVIGEGIESCMSVAVAVPEIRVLCAVSQGNMGGVWLPQQIGVVILALDNDHKPAARLAAQRVTERYMQRGINVRMARSPYGNDFNDALQGAA